MGQSAAKEIGGTFRLVIEALKEKKAYLALFCLATLGAAVVSIAIWRSGTGGLTFEVAGLLVFLLIIAILLSMLDVKGRATKSGPGEKIGVAALREVGNLAKAIEEIHIPTLGNLRVLDWYLADKESKDIERLHFLISRCNVEIRLPIKTKLTMATYFYKMKQFEKALSIIDDIPATYSASPGEVEFYKALILMKIDKNAEATYLLEEAVKAQYPNSKCYLCTCREQLEDFAEIVKKCPKGNSSQYCAERLSFHLYKKAKILRQNEEDRALNLKNALNVLNDTIDKFDSTIAYYNKACTISMLGQYKVITEDMPDVDKIVAASLWTLKEAVDRSKQLLVHSLSDIDLRWLRQNYVREFDLIVGQALRKHQS